MPEARVFVRDANGVSDKSLGGYAIRNLPRGSLWAPLALADADSVKRAPGDPLSASQILTIATPLFKGSDSDESTEAAKTIVGISAFPLIP